MANRPYTGLYTYQQAKVEGLVREHPHDKYMAAGYVSGLPGVRAAVRNRALIGYAAARAVLALHVSGRTDTANPRIEFAAGNRTDYHINLVVDVDGSDLKAIKTAYAIEYGRGPSTKGQLFKRSVGKGDDGANGVYALTSALAAMGF